MHLFKVSALFAALAAPGLAAVTPLIKVEKFDGETTGRYIVQLKDGVTKSTLFPGVNQATVFGNITHEWSIFNGFAAELDSSTLNALRANPDVEAIDEDGIMHITGVQTDAPWGLARISSPKSLSDSNATSLNFTYTYPDDKAGSGVDIYIVDTGVRTTHVTFGGRATWGATFGSDTDADGHGHGTHVAGTAAGSEYGVAKNASIIAVKVLGDDGSGTVSGIVSGLDWVNTQTASTGNPSVVTMSLGGSASRALDRAVRALTSAGVHVAVAAGNDDDDASFYSPARVPSAITVGASAIDDVRASFSNYGAPVDIFAPGKDIISAWNTDDTATNQISGTSMATPHISGLIAYLLARDGNVSPAEMQTKIQNLAQKDALEDIPLDTVNYLAQNQ